MNLLVFFVAVAAVVIQVTVSEKDRSVVFKKEENRYPRAEVEVKDLKKVCHKFTLTIAVNPDDETAGTPISYGEYFSILVKPRSSSDKGSITIIYGNRQHRTNQGPSAKIRTVITISYYERRFRIQFNNNNENFNESWQEKEDVNIFTEVQKLVLGQKQNGRNYTDGFIGSVSDFYMYESVYSYEEIVRRRGKDEQVVIDWMTVQVLTYDGATIKYEEVAPIDGYTPIPGKNTTEKLCLCPCKDDKI